MKHDRLSVAPFAFAAVCGLAIAFGPAAGAQNPPPAPPVPVLNPTPPVATPIAGPTDNPSAVPTIEASPTPSPTPTPAPRGRHHRRSSPSATASPTVGPEPSATPTSPAFATLDGTWETQLQYIDHTDYSYLALHQTTGGALSGEWRVNGKVYPLDGTYDGRLIKLTAKEPAATVVFSGYVEGASDMIGLVDLGDNAKNPTPFTAEHRGFVDNNPLHAGRKHP